MSEATRPELVGGRFALAGLLGSGATASVFAATDTAGGDRLVAIKMLHPHLTSTEAERRAFFGEAERASLVSHPSVPRVLATGVDEVGRDQYAWIATEFAAGTTMAELVARGPLAAVDALAVVTALLDGVAAIHATGLAHRDLAPQNIVITEDGAVRILDFGLSETPGSPATSSDVLRSRPDDAGRLVLGSANYLSPEHARGDAVDERSDLYQIAGLLHFLLTGRPPFPRATVAAVLDAHRSAPPPVPSVLDSRIPRSVDRIVVRGMLKQPPARYGSAEEMAAAVAEAAAGLAARDATASTPVSFTISMPPARSEATALIPSVGGTALPVRRPGAGPLDPRRPQPTRSSATAADSRSATAPMSAASARPAKRSAAIVVATSLAVVATIWLIAANAVTGGEAPLAPASADPVTAVATGTPTPSAQLPVAPSAAPPAASRVPTIIGLGRGEALRRITAAGLAVGAIAEQDGPAPRGLVLASAPEAGTETVAGAQVDLTIASGFSDVPEVRGRAVASAGGVVVTAGFSVAERTVVDSTVPDGTVIGSEPAVGTRLALGEVVVIVITRLLPAPPATSGPTGTPSPAPSRTP
ncbi:serine/threonine-protein kinase [Leifsonia poae]|uniref:serine/threonine-protein kinase n=1 Tax=Leifsonia poae TaxID=110933 RepID=UPI001CBCA7C2|nr:serine/threonine-protein kinase [Leifsonia poae]